VIAIPNRGDLPVRVRGRQPLARWGNVHARAARSWGARPAGARAYAPVV